MSSRWTNGIAPPVEGESSPHGLALGQRGLSSIKTLTTNGIELPLSPMVISSNQSSIKVNHIYFNWKLIGLSLLCFVELYYGLAHKFKLNSHPLLLCMSNLAPTILMKNWIIWKKNLRNLMHLSSRDSSKPPQIIVPLPLFTSLFILRNRAFLFGFGMLLIVL